MLKINENSILREKIINFRQLLREYIDRNDISKAIDDREIVKIRYEGEKTSKTGSGWRTIEPFVLGTTKKGNLVIRAWEQAGSSDSFAGIGRKPRADHEQWGNYHDEGPGIVPGWRLFRLDGIKQILYTGKKFDSKDAAKLAKYHPNDNGMSSIIVSAIPVDPSQIKVKGIGDVVTPDVTLQNKSVFDPQTKKWKNLPIGDKENKLKLKSNILSIANFVQRKQKEPMKNWLIISDAGKIFPVRDNNKNRTTYGDKILGNLNSLYQKYFGSALLDKSRFLKSRRDFETQLKRSLAKAETEVEI